MWPGESSGVSVHLYMYDQAFFQYFFENYIHEATGHCAILQFPISRVYDCYKTSDRRSSLSRSSNAAMLTCAVKLLHEVLTATCTNSSSNGSAVGGPLWMICIYVMHY